MSFYPMGTIVDVIVNFSESVSNTINLTGISMFIIIITISVSNFLCSGFRIMRRAPLCFHVFQVRRDDDDNKAV
jgi:hypothetical protein